MTFPKYSPTRFVEKQTSSTMEANWYHCNRQTSPGGFVSGNTRYFTYRGPPVTVSNGKPKDSLYIEKQGGMTYGEATRLIETNHTRNPDAIYGIGQHYTGEYFVIRYNNFENNQAGRWVRNNQPVYAPEDDGGIASAYISPVLQCRGQGEPAFVLAPVSQDNSAPIPQGNTMSLETIVLVGTSVAVGLSALLLLAWARGLGPAHASVR